MMANSIKILQLHYLVSQLLLKHNIRQVLLTLDRRFFDFWFNPLFFVGWDSGEWQKGHTKMSVYVIQKLGYPVS